MWQGSLESYESKGEFVTDAMSAAGFSAMTVGNHEFDWGIEYIESNAEIASFPFLGGNIFQYGTENRNENFGISTIIEKPSAKIGIVGMIGEGQTTSITSRFVEDLDFVSPVSLSLAEAKRLKEEEDTDINILLIHDDASHYDFESSMPNGKSFSDYFDAVFCGHTHSYNNFEIGGVPALQAYSNGNAFSHATITFDNDEITKRDGEVVYSDPSFRTDEDVEEVVEDYLTEDLMDLGGRVAGNIIGSFDKQGVGRLGCKAMYEAMSEDHPNLVLTMMNSQRDGLSGQVTYSDIFKATPFSNQIVIASIKGSDILHEAAFVPTYTPEAMRNIAIDSDSYYECAVIDYLYFHMNTNKQYDYFYGNRPGGGNEVIGIYDTSPYTLIFDYLQDQQEISASEHAGAINGYDLYS